MSPLLRVWARWLIPVLLLGIGAGMVAANLAYVRAAPARSDFVARWEGGRAWVQDRASPYDAEVSLRAQERVYGRPANLERGEDPQHFLYPFPSLIVFAPLGLLDLGVAQALWISLIELALIGSTLLWGTAVQWKGSGWTAAATLGFSALWFPAFASIVGAQFAAVEALLMAAAVVAILAGRDAAAGILLALCLLKPQLGIGLVVYAFVWAIVARRAALVGWFITALVALGGVSLLLEPQWPADMVRQVLDYLALPIRLSPAARLAESMGIGSFGTLLISGILLLYLVWEWRGSIRGDERRFLWTVAMTQAVLLIVAPFAIAANLVTLMLPIVVILEAWSARQGRSVALPSVLLLALIGILSWVVSLDALDGGAPSLWLTFGVPLLTMVGLFWIRWWTMRARTWPELERRAV